MALYEYRDSEFIRKHRLQLIEDSFKYGMFYTNTPLTEGYSKVLVNFDLHDSGASLTPRAGLRSTRMFIPNTTVTDHCIGTEQILTAGEQYVDNKSYAQFMVLKELTETMYGKLHQGTMAMLTGNRRTVFTADKYKVTTELYEQQTYANAMFVTPYGAEIHGMSLDDSEILTKQVGTPAWNHCYYFFDPILHKLVYSKWNTENEIFEFVTVDPKEINSNTAVSWGYNMLLQNPYTFTNSFSAAGGVIDFDGILPYNSNGTLNLTPVTNQVLTFKLFYSVPQNMKYHLVWDWRSSAADTWTTIKEYDTTFSSITDQQVGFAPPDEAIIMRVTAYGYTLSGSDWIRNTYVDATIAVGFNFDKKSYGASSNLANVNYTLEQVSGLTYWKNRLVAWGVPEDPTILFTSDVNDPTYFPYPNGVETFEEPIKYAIPFMNYLLVFTSSKLYLLTLSLDGLSWTTSCIQNNLSITDWDIHLIQVVKNMVFFRSGNYYYMIVPKSGSTTGELTLAAVSKPLYYFFDNFEENVKSIVNDAYDYRGSLTLVHYYNYLDFEDVHNVYVFRTDNAEYLNFCLLYNTTDRSWRVYCYGSQSIRVPYKADATQRGTICSISSISNGATGTYATPQLFKFNTDNRSDFYVPRGVTTTNIDDVFAASHIFKNWQILDTGYREHSSNFKKRYRELQFILNNISNLALNFYTDFYIDGEQRKNRYTYQVVQELDTQSPNYGLLTVEKILSEPIIAPSTTALGASDTDYTAWRLDSSMFPDVSFWKVRLPVSGKGYTPRFNFTSRNEELYELLNISYVYRSMGSR